MRLALRLAACALVLAVAGCATTAPIRGTLALPRTTAHASSAVAGGRASRTTPDVREAVAFIVDDRETGPTHDATPAPRCVCQTKSGFEPRVIVVPAGSTVAFKNCDTIYHSVFSLAGVRPFDTGLYAPGLDRPVRFERPGIVNLTCALHPRSIGYVVVTPNRHYARPDSLGEFQLPHLKPGTYTVKAWHPLYGEMSRKLRVTKDGATALRLAF